MSCDCVAHLPSSLHATCHKYLQPDCYYNSTQNGRRQTSDGIVRAGSSGKLQIAYCIQKNLQLATFNLQFNQIQQTVVSMRHLTVCVCGWGMQRGQDTNKVNMANNLMGHLYAQAKCRKCRCSDPKGSKEPLNWTHTALAKSFLVKNAQEQPKTTTAANATAQLYIGKM